MEKNRSIEAWRELAIGRSNQDAKQSNEHLRAAAQAAILISGGAATAVLAFLSSLIGKQQLDLHLATAGGTAIIAYASGVACAPCTIWFMNIAQKHWNRSWQEVLRHPANPEAGAADHKKAVPWYITANVFLALSIISFVVGSVFLGIGFLNAKWPVSIPAICYPAGVTNQETRSLP